MRHRQTVFLIGALWGAITLLELGCTYSWSGTWSGFTDFLSTVAERSELISSLQALRAGAIRASALDLTARLVLISMVLLVGILQGNKRPLPAACLGLGALACGFYVVCAHLGVVHAAEAIVRFAIGAEAT